MDFNNQISRKRFLQMLGLGGMYLSSLGGKSRILGTPAPAPIVINLLLEGGPDLKHLFVPPVSADPASYGGNYWKFRASAQEVDPVDVTAWQNRYNSDYVQVARSGFTFGILNRCGWLIDKFNAGNVAIISNVIHSDTRDHARSLLELQHGVIGAPTQGAATVGWGGSLTQNSGGQILSITDQMRPFCNRPDGNRNLILSANNTRNIGLYYEQDLTTTPDSTSPSAIMTRAMRSYYTRKSLLTGTVYQRFQDSELRLRTLGDQVRNRLDANPVPTAIENLSSGNTALNRRGFANQIRSVYDSFLCADIPGYDFRAMSLNYSGWDTHKRQRQSMGDNLEDIFGTGKGLDALTSSLPAADNNRTVFVIAGEFGRQLRSNGDSGTDHGRGNYVILIGNPVLGGVYGNMFPDSEIANFSSFNKDTVGLTSLQQILGKVCDWHSGSGNIVFPGYATTAIEPGLNLAGLI